MRVLRAARKAVALKANAAILPPSVGTRGRRRIRSAPLVPNAAMAHCRLLLQEGEKHACASALDSGVLRAGLRALGTDHRQNFLRRGPSRGRQPQHRGHNVSRLCGFGWGVATLLCDVLKGALPVWAALQIDPAPLFVTLVGLACVLGHVFSCFMRFKGGKAVATSIGVFLPLAFWQLLIAAALCLLAIWRSGYVSLGSLTLVTTLPPLLLCSGAWNWRP